MFKFLVAVADCRGQENNGVMTKLRNRSCPAISRPDRWHGRGTEKLWPTSTVAPTPCRRRPSTQHRAADGGSTTAVGSGCVWGQQVCLSATAVEDMSFNVGRCVQYPVWALWSLNVRGLWKLPNGVGSGGGHWQAPPQGDPRPAIPATAL